MRLDKYLADLGIGTRKEIKKLIQAHLKKYLIKMEKN